MSNESAKKNIPHYYDTPANREYIRKALAADDPTISELTETKKADRQKMIDILQLLALIFYIPCEVIDPFHGDPKQIAISFNAPKGLQLTVDFDGGGNNLNRNVHVLSWHMDYQIPDYIISAEFGPVRNQFHFRKATDVAYGFAHLIQILHLRFSCIQDKKHVTKQAPSKRREVSPLPKQTT